MNNTGSCLCGKITFSVKEFMPSIGHCHCRMCQKFHGAAFSTFVEVKRHHLTWLSGEKLLVEYQADNETVRKFCQCCGSSLIFESKYNRLEDSLEIALAVFDHCSHQENIQPNAHIYMGSKVSWLTINDDLPQYKNYREHQ